jgi:hypothetical protein
MAKYQTGRLDDYDPKLQKLAEGLYLDVKKAIGDRIVKLPGSYSILGAKSEFRAAKIIIYEEGVGRGLRDELLRDAVYVLVRANDSAEHEIWKGPVSLDPGFEKFFNQMDVGQTIEVAPNYEEPFAFFPFRPEEQALVVRLLSDASRSIR